MIDDDNGAIWDSTEVRAIDYLRRKYKGVKLSGLSHSDEYVDDIPPTYQKIWKEVMEGGEINYVLECDGTQVGWLKFCLADTELFLEGEQEKPLTLEALNRTETKTFYGKFSCGSEASGQEVPDLSQDFQEFVIQVEDRMDLESSLNDPQLIDSADATSSEPTVLSEQPSPVPHQYPFSGESRRRHTSRARLPGD